MMKRFMHNSPSSLMLSLCLSVAVALPAGLVRAQDLAAAAATAARERGAGQTPLLMEQGQIPAAELQRWPVQLAPRQCVVVSAASRDARDLELSLKTPEGLSLTDSEVGPLARLRYCAGLEAEKALVRLRSDTAVAYALGVWPARVPGEPTKPAPTAAAPAPKSLGQQLAALATARANSFEAMTPPREEDLGAGDPRERDVPLEAGRCYRFLAVADLPLTAVNLTLADAQGTPLLSARGGELTSVLGEDTPFCPEDAARYKLVVAAEGGSGRVLWQVFGESQVQTQGKWPIGGGGESLIAKRIRSIHERLGEKKQPAVAYQEGRLATAQSVEVGFDVQPGFCYVAVAAGMPSIRSLDLEIVDQRGNLVAQARDQGSQARARACSDIKARWTARVGVFKGYGEYGTQVFGGP